MKNETSKFVVYILKTNKNTLYTGYTSNIQKRLLQHSGKLPGGAKYMKRFTEFELVFTQEFETKSEAMKCEAKIKKLSHAEKLRILVK